MDGKKQGHSYDVPEPHVARPGSMETVGRGVYLQGAISVTVSCHCRTISFEDLDGRYLNYRTWRREGKRKGKARYRTLLKTKEKGREGERERVKKEERERRKKKGREREMKEGSKAGW